MNEHIVSSIKSLLDIAEEDHTFNSDVLAYVNGAFYSLRQLGVGPKDGFVVTEDTTWGDFLNDESLLSEVKLYVQQKVRLLFDPPTNSFLVSAIQDNIKELEWRLNVHGEGFIDD